MLADDDLQGLELIVEDLMALYADSSDTLQGPVA